MFLHCASTRGVTSEIGSSASAAPCVEYTFQNSHAHLTFSTCRSPSGEACVGAPCSSASRVNIHITRSMTRFALRAWNNNPTHGRAIQSHSLSLCLHSVALNMPMNYLHECRWTQTIPTCSHTNTCTYTHTQCSPHTTLAHSRETEIEAQSPCEQTYTDFYYKYTGRHTQRQAEVQNNTQEHK